MQVLELRLSSPWAPHLQSEDPRGTFIGAALTPVLSAEGPEENLMFPGPSPGAELGCQTQLQAFLFLPPHSSAGLCAPRERAPPGASPSSKQPPVDTLMGNQTGITHFLYLQGGCLPRVSRFALQSVATVGGAGPQPFRANGLASRGRKTGALMK